MSRAAARSTSKEGKELWYLKPSHVFPLEPDEADVVEKVEALFN